MYILSFRDVRNCCSCFKLMVFPGFYSNALWPSPRFIVVFLCMTLITRIYSEDKKKFEGYLIISNSRLLFYSILSCECCLSIQCQSKLSYRPTMQSVGVGRPTFYMAWWLKKQLTSSVLGTVYRVGLLVKTSRFSLICSEFWETLRHERQQQLTQVREVSKSFSTSRHRRMYDQRSFCVQVFII